MNMKKRDAFFLCLADGSCMETKLTHKHIKEEPKKKSFSHFTVEYFSISLEAMFYDSKWDQMLQF